MGAILTDIASAVVTALNGAAFAAAYPTKPTFTAVRLYRPRWELADLDTLRVCVVPKGREIELLARSSNEELVSVDVGVQQRVAADDLATADRLMELCDAVTAFFLKQRLVGCEQAIGVDAKVIPFAPEHLDTAGVFTAVVTLGFRLVR